MKKTAISMLLVLALVLSFVLVAAPAAQAAGHEHCVCGGIGKIGDHTACTNVTWTDLNAKIADYRKVDGEKVWYELPTGNYYLSANLDIADANGKDAAIMLIEADVSICLNGFKLSLSGNNNLRMFCDAADAAKSLTFCDCKGTGEVYGGNRKGDTDTAANGQLVRLGRAAENAATLNIFGGKFSAVAGDASTGALFRLGDAGKLKVTFNMYGGTITGGKTATASGKNGANIAIYGTMNMYGGAVTNGVATGKAGNILLGGTGSGATVNIKGGTVSGGEPNDIAAGDVSHVINIESAKSAVKVLMFEGATLKVGANLTKTNAELLYTVAPKNSNTGDSANLVVMGLGVVLGVAGMACLLPKKQTV